MSFFGVITGLLVGLGLGLGLVNPLDLVCLGLDVLSFSVSCSGCE